MRFNHNCIFLSETLLINCGFNPTPLTIYSIYFQAHVNIYFIFLLLKMRERKGQTTTKTSNFVITQSVAQILFDKYDNQFNFYLTKSINHIIFNQKSEKATLTAKDIAMLVEDIEYLKRYYAQKNDQGKNQIKDRMCKLLKFYATANMLQYQYPCMVINKMEEVFKKRRKKLWQGENQQQSEEESEESLSEKQIFVKKQTEKEGQELVMLNNLDWSDIINFNQPQQKEKTVKEILDFQEQFSIYEEQSKKKDNFFGKIDNLTSEITYQMSFDEIQNQKQVGYLILDFDDLDKQRIVNQYTKLTNKQNIPSHKNQGALKMLRIQSLTQKKPLSSSITIDSFKQFGIKQRNRELQANNRQSMFIGSRYQRDQQIKVMKKSSDFQHQAKKTFLFSQDMIINQNQCEESPLNIEFSSFPKRSDFSNHFLTFQNKNKQGQGIMKQSQIMHNDYFIKDKNQKYDQNNFTFKSQLKKLKENPFELKQTLKMENHNQGDCINFNKQDFRDKQHKNELPFYLKRVKSHEQLKPFVHDDKGFQKFKKIQ